MPRGVPKSGFRMTAKRIAANSVASVSKSVESRFSINERFGFVTDLVKMVAKNDTPSVIICGAGGLGKSHTVNTALRDSGFRDMTLVDNYQIGMAASGSNYVVIKGYSTPKGLYRTLYENNGGVIVFDDCDSVLKDAVSLNLLKAALDSYSKRIISWRADIRDDDLPTSFLFTGRIVFISNMDSSTLDQAILSRSMVVDLSMTPAQKVERMRHLIKQADFMPDFSSKIKSDSMDLIDTLKDSIKELSLRSLIKTAKIRATGNKNWKDLAEYSLVG